MSAPASFDAVPIVHPPPVYCEHCKRIFMTGEQSLSCVACRRVHYCCRLCMLQDTGRHQQGNRCDPHISHDDVSENTSQMLDAFKLWHEYHKQAISFFAFQCFRQTTRTVVGGFPVIVLIHRKDSRYVPAHRVRCVDVYYLDIDHCPAGMTQLVLNVCAGKQGCAYVITNLEGLWFVGLGDRPTHIPESPRIRNWAPGLLAVLESKWKFVDVDVLYDYCTKYTPCPTGALDCDGTGIGPGFRQCENSVYPEAPLIMGYPEPTGSNKP